MLRSRSRESESRESKVFTRSRSQSWSQKKDFPGVGSQSRTEINPGSQSRSRTEKMAENQSGSQSRTDFALTLQRWLKLGCQFFCISLHLSDKCFDPILEYHPLPPQETPSQTIPKNSFFKRFKLWRCFL